MSIVGNNSILNQYVPTFLINNPLDGQSVLYDSTVKAFVNQSIIDLPVVSGQVKCSYATVPLNANATVNIGSVLPANSIVLSVRVNVLTADSSATISLGFLGDLTAYLGVTPVNSTGLTIVHLCRSDNLSLQVLATVAGSTEIGTGSCLVVIEYMVP